MTRIRTLFTATALVALTACMGTPIPSAMDASSLQQHVATNYGGNYQEFADTEWGQIKALVWEGDLQTLRMLHAQGVDLDPPVSTGQDTLLYTAATVEQYDIARWLVNTAQVDPNNSFTLQWGATQGYPQFVRTALMTGDLTFYMPNCGSGPCIGPRGALQYQQRSSLARDSEVIGLLENYVANPANAERIAMAEQSMRSGLAEANSQPQRQPTTTAMAGGPGVVQTQQSSGPDAGDRAMIGLMGQLGGSLLGGIVGGSDGDLMGSTFSNIMGNVATADSGTDVMTGTLLGMGQSSGLMDAGTASAVGLFGEMFSGTGQSAQMGQNTAAAIGGGSAGDFANMLGGGGSAPSVNDFGTMLATGAANATLGSTAPSAPQSTNNTCVAAGGMIDPATGQCIQRIDGRNMNLDPNIDYSRRVGDNPVYGAGPGFDPKQRPQSNSGVNAAMGAAQAGMTNYTFSCPMGSGPHTIPIPATASPQCQTAMRTFAYTASCNLIDEMMQAQDAYYSTCASEIFQ
jgi:hypothetical protein